MQEQPEQSSASEQIERDQLRVLFCGSVDDGKSTLIGRLLYDCDLVSDDQLVALRRDSCRYGSTGEAIDFSLLLDGLEAEREQQITIDVAYRYFSTEHRAFIIADAPGHEQYTRNMVTGASTCDAAVILVDATKGLSEQTRRHTCLCSLMGLRHIVLAVNKMDVLAYAQGEFEQIVTAFCSFARDLSFAKIETIPLSARYGDNVVSRSGQMPWYQGRTLMEQLEAIDTRNDALARPFRLEVELVSRPNSAFRGYSGTIRSGSIRRGERISVAPSMVSAGIRALLTADGELSEAQSGDAITVTLDEQVDVARGDLLFKPTVPPEVADQFSASLVWLAEEAMLPGRTYLLRIGARWVNATVTAIKHRIDIGSLAPVSARQLSINEIAFCNVSTSRPIAFDPYVDNRATGAFILVDRESNKTCAAGMIAFALRRAANLHPERLAVDKAARSELKHQRPLVIWFTGLSGAGKSTIARLVEQRLFQQGRHTYMLDGDNLRRGLNRDLGFTDADRVENIRRVGETAKLFVDAGLIVLCAFISPFAAERRMVREMMGEGEFIEVFVDATYEECARRDPKGLYAKVRAGSMKNFTGFDSPYEPPVAPELVLDTLATTPAQCADIVLQYLAKRITSTQPAV
jgi:bifunctional enzyme CysN/CysC